MPDSTPTTNPARPNRLSEVLSALPIKLVALAQGIQSLGKTESRDDDVLRELILLLLLSEQAGHSGCVLAEVADQPWGSWVDGLKVPCQVASLAELEKALLNSGLLGGDTGRGPLVFRAGMLFRRTQYLAELAWRGAIEQRCESADTSQATSSALDPMLADIESTLGYDLSPSKRAACEQLCTAPFGVLLGGPGTGKTTTLAALIELYQHTNIHEKPRIVLLAPTGKAAQRMHESLISSPLSAWQGLCEPPSTVHRFLAKPPLFRPTLVIVDESSMIDVQLMERLLVQVPTDSRLLLVGDPYQLNSVSSGAVLRDVVSYCREQGYPCVAELTESFRFSQGSGLHDLAAAIHRGVSDEFAPLDDTVELLACADDNIGDDGLAPYRLSHVLNFPMTQEWSARWSWLREAIVLCAQRRGAGGTYAVNHRCALAFQERFRPHSQGKWFVGMPVMVTQNNYTEQVFNGDVGIIWHHPDDALQLVVAFPDGDSVRFINPYLLGELVVAYAITVHKSQGSEYDHVHVVLPHTSDIPIAREWIYTAVTRAKSRVSLIGATNRLGDVIAQVTQRWTLATADAT